MELKMKSYTTLEAPAFAGITGNTAMDTNTTDTNTAGNTTDSNTTQKLPAIAICDTSSAETTAQIEPPAEPVEVEGKKIMPATAATGQETNANNHADDTTNHGVTQQLGNLPAEILALPRWLPTRKDKPKAPVGNEWQLPENQKPFAEVEGIKGFMAATEANSGLLFVDFDHCINPGTGEFINTCAADWFNRIQQGKFFAELSKSGTGCHMWALPTAGDSAKTTGRIYLTEDEKSFIDVFYGKNQFCLPTGKLFRCQPNSPIATGEEADKILQELRAALADQKAKEPPKQHSFAPRIYEPLSDNPEYDQWRAQRMLDIIDPARLSYDDWFAVNTACKTVGLSYSIVDNFNRRDSADRYNERENLAKWNEPANADFSIETLHGIAKRFGYSEKDSAREWHNLRGDREPTDKPAPMKTKQGLAPEKSLTEDEAKRDELIDSLFDGDGSDRAFAKRLETFCGDRVRWLDKDKRWYTYSDGVWTAGGGENSAIANFADNLAETMQQYASNAAEQKLADKFQSSKKIGCAINLLKARASVRITRDDLDQHPELLNVLNGVVNLQTGELREAAPELLLTKQAAAAFTPEADTAFVEEFFKAIQPDEESRAGLLRWLGYCLTSETREHKFAVWTGASGANGKSTLSGVMLKLAGGYGTGLNPRALLKNNRPSDANTATTGLNQIEGVRFALAEELPLNAELDSSLIKTLSGGDAINLRLNYGEYRTVPNFAKINISGNFMPRLENVNDGGIRRRLLNFAFNVRFGTADHPADPQLKDKLILPENLRGLLALLVREAVAWYRDGLIISDAMKAETQRILDESNFVADFLEDGEQYIKVPTAEVKAKEFIEALRLAYPRECSQFNKRADLIRLIAAQDGVTYGENSERFRVFKGIGKAARDSNKRASDKFGGEPIDPKDTPF